MLASEVGRNGSDGGPMICCIVGDPWSDSDETGRAFALGGFGEDASRRSSLTDGGSGPGKGMDGIGKSL